MRHNVGYRKLGRTSSHRRALLRNLATDLFRHERLKTTLPKARELRPFAEKLITLARRDDLHARRQVVRHISDGAVMAIVELVGSEPTFKKQKEDKKARRDRKAKVREKEVAAAESAEGGQEPDEKD